MISPVLIEKRFQELLAQLSGVLSKRAKLTAITQFIKELPSPISSYESYLMQLLGMLPVFESPYEYTGISPDLLQEHVSIIKHGYKNAFDFESEELEDWLSKMELVVQSIYNWVGERAQSEKVSQSISIFEPKLAIQNGIHTVLVPVLENIDQEYSGRLRNLQISVVGQLNLGKHDLVPIFSVIGSESGDQVVTENPTKAVNHLTKEILSDSKKFWKATAGFENKQAWHSGNSANLAMSGLFFCSILEAQDQREQFRLNPAVVITGDISENGDVLPVSKDSLKSKVEAAFFSWSHVFVVPASQVGTIYSYLDELKEKFPKRELIVIGATHLKDLFYDRRLTLHSKKGQFTHLAERAWKKRFNLAAIITYVVMAFVIASLIIGPVDRNPYSAEHEGQQIVIKNQTGRELGRIEVDPFNIDLVNARRFGAHFDLTTIHDFNNDGVNEILVNEILSPEVQLGRLTLLSSNAKDTIWSRELRFPDVYKKHPYAYGEEYRGRLIEVADIDGDLTDEILLTSEQEKYFQSNLSVISSKTGDVLQNYKGTGWFSLLKVYDFDKDGKQDVLVCGDFKGFKINGCSLLSAQNISGYTPLSDRYYDETKFRAIEKFIFLVPNTVIGKHFREANSDQNYSMIYGESLYKENESIFLTFSDVRISTNEDRITANLHLDFDFRFNLKAIASFDEYDILANEYYENGQVPFIADAQYLHSFRDSLLWWNGTEFQPEPTLNPAYLESVGEDSSYYKEWYFSKKE